MTEPNQHDKSEQVNTPTAHKSQEEAFDSAPKQSAPQEAEPAQEWGQRQDTGKAIHRGGKTEGPVPGATGK